MAGNPAIQLRLDYSGPPSPVTAGLSLNGLTLVVTPYHGSSHDAAALLSDAGVSVSVSPRGITLPLAELSLLAAVSGDLTLEPTPDVELALMLARSVAASSVPVTVVVDGDSLRVTFVDGSSTRSAVMRDETVTALLLAEIPFAASAAAWQRLSATHAFPMVLARAALNHDGFVELHTGNPQSLEASPLPGLFKMADARYGLSVAFRSELLALGGVDAGPLGADEVPELADCPVELTPELAAARDEVAFALSNRRGAVVCYRSGLGRRTAALAALVGLDAWPALVLCPPHSLWMWSRQLDMFGVSASLTLSSRADAHLVTYLDLVLGARLRSYSSLVFDDLTGEAQAALPALERLRVFSDAYRLGVASQWPEDPELSCQLLNVVRPGEFDLDGMPLSWRYPGRTVERAEEHARCYLLARDYAPSETRFRQSQTLVVPAPDLLVRDHAAVLARFADGDLSGAAALSEARALSSYGSVSVLSPKVSAVVSLVRDNADAGPIAVVTSSHAAALAVRSAVLPLRATVSNRADAAPARLLVHVGAELPDLSSYDLVVFMDYPLSCVDIDNAVGPAWSDHGSATVIVLHSPGMVDDRLAVFCVLNGERATAAADLSLTDDDYASLLSHRWPTF